MKKTLSIVLAAIMLLCMIPTIAVFAEEDKFATIDTAAEFDEFTKAVNAGTYTPATGATIKVTADLDMRDITDFQPINTMTGFALDFDGHTVSNLVVTTNGASWKNGSNDPSLVNERFAGIIVHNAKEGSSVLNLKLNNCQLNANARRIGMVAGYVEKSVINTLLLKIAP